MLNHIGTQTIETERMILRRFEYSDNGSMRKNWISNEKIQSLYSEPVYTTEGEVRELLDKYIGSYNKEDYYRWAIIEKCGLTYEGTLRDYFYMNGEYVGRLFFSILRDEYTSQ